MIIMFKQDKYKGGTRYAKKNDETKFVVSRSNDINELYHYGVKGMKWGVRKYQNSDGTLTDIGKNRISKEYRKYLNKAHKDLNKGYPKRYYNAYNKAANDMNNGLIDRYNKEYEKMGKRATNHDYANDKSYAEGYEKIFEKTMSNHYNRALIQDILSNPNYKKLSYYAQNTQWKILMIMLKLILTISNN